MRVIALILALVLASVTVAPAFANGGTQNTSKVSKLKTKAGNVKRK